ncbi:alpha/beta hydrolase family protein [Zunongwangia atlantica]|uniref:Dipeptidylaminopeptidase/acylaminoacyl-peptidase-like protein n=1 Tax=Zunongwangia atlantica 22II14-10F7 TaxID=1185767 RepID=A0A1Y1T540_9FLAO|nr:prolyl oligopeptidase family serine peptidase [Zunongwangia atlantica]ORL46156.1 dipeptidylaminopeptidase/acylaminoacyl- peptidase -like protein [Zunongwangia atlantica 22II14-10F7]|tara:strand:- start:21525 stop:22547 length:1023 start_codon:yes stop_codon:yes gene_type:complete
MGKQLIYVVVLLYVVALKGQSKEVEDSLALNHSTEATRLDSYIKYDDTRETNWDNNYKLVGIKSSFDANVQKAYLFKSVSETPRPLIVSLHTWSGDYTQKDEIADLCRLKNINYIHPNFRGQNTKPEGCMSKLAISDIDDAIAYALNHLNVDTSKIYVVGVSGGGYATLSTFMKSKHKISKFSAWASITDLVAWYEESKIRKNKYAQNILDCTDSGIKLNIDAAIERSPYYWETPIEKLNNAELHIYAGVFDGIQGSVPITQSINFYNKLLSDLSVTDKTVYVSDEEKLKLLECRQALGNYGSLYDRQIILVKEYGNLSLTIFEGNHEILPEYAVQALIN